MVFELTVDQKVIVHAYTYGRIIAINGNMVDVLTDCDKKIHTIPGSWCVPASNYATSK